MIWHFLKVLQECLLFAAQNAEILQNLKKTKIYLWIYHVHCVYIVYEHNIAFDHTRIPFLVYFLLRVEEFSTWCSWTTKVLAAKQRNASPKDFRILGDRTRRGMSLWSNKLEDWQFVGRWQHASGPRGPCRALPSATSVYNLTPTAYNLRLH